MDFQGRKNGKIIVINNGKILLRMLTLIIKQVNGFIYVNVQMDIIHLQIVNVNMDIIMIQPHLEMEFVNVSPMMKKEIHVLKAII